MSPIVVVMGLPGSGKTYLPIFIASHMDLARRYIERMSIYASPGAEGSYPYQISVISGKLAE